MGFLIFLVLLLLVVIVLAVKSMLYIVEYLKKQNKIYYDFIHGKITEANYLRNHVELVKDYPATSWIVNKIEEIIL